MIENQGASVFREECKSWLCDGYSCEIRYVVHKNKSTGKKVLLNGSVTFASLCDPRRLGFQVETADLIAGLIQLERLPIHELEVILDWALKGTIQVDNEFYKFAHERVGSTRISGQSEQEAQQLQCRVFSEPVGYVPIEPQSLIFTPALDDELRAGAIPFDGFDDLIQYLSLPDSRFGNSRDAILIAIEPPADLVVDECRLEKNGFVVRVRAHSTFNTYTIGLAVRGAPDGGSLARKQIGEQISWDRDKDGNWAGRAITIFENVDQVLAILMIGRAYVRRHWFTDPAKARNVRYVAMKMVDRELKQLKRYLINPDRSDKDKFEQAVADLLFLRGYNSALPLETNAPDILVMTPGGQLAVVECTLSIKDVPTKVGKLVARREEVRKALILSGHSSEVAAFLVCNSTRGEIAASYDNLREHQILLWSREDLESQVSNLQAPGDADKEMMDTKKSLAASVALVPDGEGAPGGFV